jgi:endonuclease/exonuclease/phosphatase family metal-dependent hydrolase
MAYKILFSNIGYARGIDGSLSQHIALIGRNFYNAVPVQEQVLRQVKTLIDTESPDLCCFVEIDNGSAHSARFNQLKVLADKDYPHHDIANKYGEGHWLSNLPLHEGKSSAFMAREKLEFERLYFTHGSKRLMHKIALPQGIDVLFAHFSLRRKTRVKQFEEVHALIAKNARPMILLADFNIWKGFKELVPLLKEDRLIVVNREDEHTFKFFRHHLALDLAVCSKELAPRVNLRIIPQPFSDHAALLLEISP